MANDDLQNEWNQLVTRSRQKGPPQLDPVLPAQQPDKKYGRRLILIAVFFIASLVLTKFYFWGPLNPWPAEPAPADIEAGWEASVKLTVKAIRDYATFHGHYPAQLEDAISIATATDYRVDADGFELRMIGHDGKPILIRTR